jgi:hypothetical protein
VNPALPKFCDLIATLAQQHRLGTVGLVGAHANGTAGADDPLELFITVPFAMAEIFAHTLSEETVRAVHLYDFELVPWAHPLHLCVRWLNAGEIPTRGCPPGAVMRWRMKRHGQSFEATVRLESLPHFRAEQKFVSPRTFPKSGEFMRVFGPPPLGGFLL